MPPADKQLAAVKAIAAQAGSGPSARFALIASGAVPKLLKHLSSKTAAVVSQSALALSLLASDPSTRSSLWEHQRALVPAMVQILKSGGPLTLGRSLAALASLIKHVPQAGAAVIKAGGIVPLLRIAQTGSEELREAAVAALDAFHVRQLSPKMANSVEVHTCVALRQELDILEPLICTLSKGPMRAKMFALHVLGMLPKEPRVVEALRRPAVTDLLLGFASAEDPDIASAGLRVLAVALGDHPSPVLIPPEAAAYRATPKICKLWESLPSHLQSPHPCIAEASLHYLTEILGTPGLGAKPWLRQCVQNIPRLLKSESHVIKALTVAFAACVWTRRYDLWMKCLEESCGTLQLTATRIAVLLWEKSAEAYVCV
jgi:hypothetical protein